MSGRGSDAISPTAHYTGEVWRRNGLGDEALGTWQGRLLHSSVRPLFALSRALGGDTLEDFLLARHRLIDRLLGETIAAGRVGQVIEIAAGMSPRGVRFTASHPHLTYVEADLPAMAARKRAALAARRDGGLIGERHRVVDLDALEDGGPLSLAELSGSLDPELGTAVITEGLLNYFPREAVEGIWSRIAAALGAFPSGLYLSDIHLGELNSGALQRAFVGALSIFVRGRVHIHFDTEADAVAALLAAGFGRAEMHSGGEAGSAAGAARVHVIEARLGAR